MEFNLETVASFISLIGTACGLFSRVPQVYKTYKTKSVNDLSEKTMQLNINQFNQIIGKKLTNEEINSFQIQSLLNHE